jgi:hypothetical protein
VTDANGNTATNTLVFGIADDAPIAHDITRTGQADVGGNTNLLLVLDISGSMGQNNNAGILSLRNSTLALLDQYDARGDVKVRLETFSTSASTQLGANEQDGGWMSVSSARDIVSTLLDNNGSTNYDRALITAMTAFATTGKIDGAQNVGYFISDGLPNGGTSWAGVTYSQGNAANEGIQIDEQLKWEQFLNTSDIRMFALGTGGTLTALNPVAYNGMGAGAQADGILTSTNGLGSTLVATMAALPISGNLLTDSSPNGTFGADAGWIDSVTINGVKYSYFADHAQDAPEFSVTGGASQGSYLGTSWTIATTGGGHLLVDMVTGEYTYTPPANVVTNGVAESDISFTLKDSDGDTSTAPLTITLGGGSYAAQVGTDADNSGGLFDRHTDGSGVHNVLMGMGGTDTLIGGAGNDLISGGQGSDNLTGGLGADVFRWGVADHGTTGAPAADHITDFTVNGPGKDVLDLRDLLVGEHSSGSGANLASFLHFGEVTTGSGGSAVTSTVISVDHDGGSTFAADQTIKLDGVSLSALQHDLGALSTSNADLIAKLLANGNLKTDV